MEWRAGGEKQASTVMAAMVRCRRRWRSDGDEAGELLTQKRGQDTARHGRQHLLRQRDIARASRDVGLFGGLSSRGHGCLWLTAGCSGVTSRQCEESAEGPKGAKRPLWSFSAVVDKVVTMQKGGAAGMRVSSELQKSPGRDRTNKTWPAYQIESQRRQPVCSRNFDGPGRSVSVATALRCGYAAVSHACSQVLLPFLLLAALTLLLLPIRTSEPWTPTAPTQRLS